MKYFWLILICSPLMIVGFFNIKGMIKALKRYKQLSIQLNDMEISLAVLEDTPLTKKQKKKLLQCYENITLIEKIIPRPPDEPMRQIVDTSLYMKDKIITLTNFVQKQDYDMLIKGAMDEATQQLRFTFGDDFEISEDILQLATENVLNQQGKLIPNANLYQLQNGLWLWTYD